MYLISAYSHNAAQLTKERKEQIRRNEQICQEQYEPPQVFRLIRCGKPRILEQGDVVLGKVKVVTTKKIACQLIYVEFKGVAKVSFNVPSTTMIDEIQNFKKEWEFFSHKIPVFMHEQRGYNFLEPGIYEFYFKARVPIDGPCTFLTDIASVTYRFSGVFVRNDVTADVFSDNHLVYHVKGYKDINSYDGARIGFWQERLVSVGGFCGMFVGQVHFKLKTDKRAFVPGEKILIIGKVSNNTWRKCTLRYDLVQNNQMWGEHYFWRSDHEGSRFLKDQLVMEKAQDRIIHPGDEIELEETLQIPKGIEPSYLGMTARDFINDLIHLEYRLRFEINIPCSTNLRLTVPIIIATEPFVFLPPPPTTGSLSKEAMTDPTIQLIFSEASDNTVGEPLVKLDTMTFGNQEPFKVPRFHPLNKHFQKKFPETFGRYREPGAKPGGNRGHQHKSKCACECHKPNKKRHRPTCNRMMRSSMRPSGAGKHSRRVTTAYGTGVPLEDCTYTNWLAASVDDYLDEEGKQTNMLLNVMKEYGLVS